MNIGISFAPLVPDYLVWSALAVAVVLAVLLLASRSRGALMRAAAMALFVLALANPSFTREDRDPLTSVVIVVVDKSASQEFGDRTKQTEAVRAALVRAARADSQSRSALRRGRRIRRRRPTARACSRRCRRR